MNWMEGIRMAMLAACGQYAASMIRLVIYCFKLESYTEDLHQ